MSGMPAVETKSKGFAQGRENVLIGALVLVVLLGIVLWQFGGLGGVAPPVPITGANNTSTNTSVKLAAENTTQGQMLLALVNKGAQFPDAYRAVMAEQSGNEKMMIEVNSNGSAFSGRLETRLYNRTYLWLGNQTVLCEQPLHELAGCTVINDSMVNGTTLAQEMRHLGDLFYPRANETKSVVAGYKKLMNEQTFGFDGNVSSQTAAGRPCKEIAYHLGQANLQVCLDEQYGVVLRQNMSYDQPYKNADGTSGYQRAYYKLEVSTLELGVPDIQMPGENVSLTAVQSLVLQDGQKLSSLQMCELGKTPEDRNRCLKESAISYDMVEFCTWSSNASAMGDCVIKMATQAGQLRPDLCARAGEMKSDCYANVAYLKGDASYCQLVENESLRAQCVQMTAPKNVTGAPASSRQNGTGVLNVSSGVYAPSSSTSIKSSATNASAPSYEPNYGRPAANATGLGNQTRAAG